MRVGQTPHPYTHPPTSSFLHTSIHLPTHPPTQFLIHPHIRPPTQMPTHPLAHTPTSSFIHTSTHPPTQPPLHPLNPSIPSPVHPSLFLSLSFFSTEVLLIYSVVLVSGVQKSGSGTYTYTHTHIIFHIIFHYGLVQDVEYRSLYYMVGHCCLSILYIVICTCQSPIPNLSLPHSLFSWVIIVSCVCESVL